MEPFIIDALSPMVPLFLGNMPPKQVESGQVRAYSQTRPALASNLDPGNGARGRESAGNQYSNRLGHGCFSQGRNQIDTRKRLGESCRGAGPEEKLTDHGPKLVAVKKSTDPPGS